MQIRNLGGSGLRVSSVGLGCNNFGQRTDLETSPKVIHKAIGWDAQWQRSTGSPRASRGVYSRVTLQAIHLLDLNHDTVEPE
jgi:hypothetical protein